MTANGIVPIFLRLDPRDIAYVKFLYESYESVAIVRTIDRRAATIVVLAVPDFIADARAIYDEMRAQRICEEIPPPPEVAGDWLLAALESDPS